jgi:hypothetical protein
MSTMGKNRRNLRQVPLTADLLTSGIVITMSVGQWDVTLAQAYEMGWTLLELDANERPVRAYRRLDRPCCSPETQDDEPR